MIYLEFDRGTLILSAPGQEVEGVLPGEHWRWDDRIKAWRCEAMHYSKVLEQLTKHFGAELQNNLPLWPRVFHSRQPRKPEKRIETAIRAWTNSGHCGQVIIPRPEDRVRLVTQAMANHPCATLVITGSSDLAYMWHNRLMSELGCEAGIIGGGDRLLRPVSTATYRSARIQMAKIGMRFEMVIFDDVQLLGDGPAREAAMLCTAPRRLGLLAATERTDGFIPLLESLSGPIVCRVNTSNGNTNNRAMSIPVELTDTEQEEYSECTRICDEYLAVMKNSTPRYNKRDLRRDPCRGPSARRAKKAMIRAEAILASAGGKLLKLEMLLAEHQSVTIFAGTDDAAMDISATFCIPTILRTTPGWERSAILDGVADGRYSALVTSAIPADRSDYPGTQAAVILHTLGRPKIRADVIYNIYCLGTPEDPTEGKIWRYDAYRRRVGH